MEFYANKNLVSSTNKARSNNQFGAHPIAPSFKGAKKFKLWYQGIRIVWAK